MFHVSQAIDESSKNVVVPVNPAMLLSPGDNCLGGARSTPLTEPSLLSIPSVTVPDAAPMAAASHSAPLLMTPPRTFIVSSSQALSAPVSSIGLTRFPSRASCRELFPSVSPQSETKPSR